MARRVQFQCEKKVGCPEYVNRNCWLADTLNSSPSKRCQFCHLKFSSCLFFQYLIISLALVLSLLAVSFLVEGRISKLVIVCIFVLVVIYGYFFNQSTEKIIEANFSERKAKEALEELTEKLEEKVEAQTRDLKAKNVYQANLTHDLEKANLRLQELDQQKTEFLSIASHQLRTPLSILKGYVELIEDGVYGKPNKEMMQIIKNLDINNENLIKLVDEFLNIARIEQGKTIYIFAKCDINHLIKKNIDEIQEKAVERGLEIVWDRNNKIGHIILDTEKIDNVLLNLLDNAIKYSEKGRIKIEAFEYEGGITVKIKDEGIGFNRGDKVNFFQKFYRGENAKGINVNGTGMGLYVCREFVEGHGGKVWARSDGIGKGSEFGFWLPRKPAGAKLAASI